MSIKLIETMEAALASRTETKFERTAPVAVQFAAGEWANIMAAVAGARIAYAQEVDELEAKMRIEFQAKFDEAVAALVSTENEQQPAGQGGPDANSAPLPGNVLPLGAGMSGAEFGADLSKQSGGDHVA